MLAVEYSSARQSLRLSCSRRSQRSHSYAAHKAPQKRTNKADPGFPPNQEPNQTESDFSEKKNVRLQHGETRRGAVPPCGLVIYLYLLVQPTDGVA